jgi:hypothetical protein
VVVVPVVGKVPLQPPEAAQVSALAAFHWRVTDAPLATVLWLAFRLTKGGATTVGVVAAPVAVSVAMPGEVKALELEPHAASVLSTVNAIIDFNSNANLEQRLRRIELITRLPITTVTNLLRGARFLSSAIFEIT